MFSTIVVAVDFSHTSRDAFAMACELARDHGSELHVIHVVNDVRLQPWMLEAPGTTFHDLQKEWVARAEQTLAMLKPPKQPARVVRKVLIGTPADTAIAQYVADQQADLLVVGTHGYGPVRRFLLGSVSDRLVRSVACPVLTVPPRLLLVQAEGATQPAQAPSVGIAIETCLECGQHRTNWRLLGRRDQRACSKDGSEQHPRHD
jgi:nucleotide-binding universal stress UspA family protein